MVDEGGPGAGLFGPVPGLRRPAVQPLPLPLARPRPHGREVLRCQSVCLLRRESRDKVDPNGQEMTDYFDAMGHFLYSDGINNGLIKITDQEIIAIAQDIPSKQEAIQYLNDNSVLFHKAFYLGIMKKDAALRVYEYYNKTGLPLVPDDNITGNFDFNNKGVDNRIRISINIEKNLTADKHGYTLDNYFDIDNALNAHEGNGHYNLYRIKGAYRYNAIPSYLREINAIKTQMAAPSWNNTTQKYKEGVKRYYLQQLQKKSQK